METEGFMLGIQDHQIIIIARRNYTKVIIKDPSITDDRCRKCQAIPETIQHITYNNEMCVTNTNRLSTQTQSGNKHHTPKTSK